MKSTGSLLSQEIMKSRATPLYEQCVQRLADEIRSGALIPGQRLPSERQLAEVMGFSRLTVRRSLFELADRGLLGPAPSRGWLVMGSPMSEPPNTLMSFTELARSRGLTASSRVISLITREAGLDEADSLRVAPGATLYVCSRLRLMDGEPIAVETLHIPSLRALWLADFDWTGSVHQSFAAHGHDPVRADVFVDVLPSDPAIADLLGVPVASGLLRVCGVTFDRGGTPISLDDIVYNPLRYRFQAVLERRIGPAEAT